jgi:hypothetical protein
MGAGSAEGIAGTETGIEVVHESEVGAAHGALVLDFRRLRVVLASVEVGAAMSAVTLGVHQVFVQLEASGSSDAD